MLTKADIALAKQCSEWVSQYKNPLSKPTSDIINKLLAEVERLEKSEADDAKYIRSLNYQDDRRREQEANSYQCGEL